MGPFLYLCRCLRSSGHCLTHFLIVETKYPTPEVKRGAQSLQGSQFIVGYLQGRVACRGASQGRTSSWLAEDSKQEGRGSKGPAATSTQVSFCPLHPTQAAPLRVVCVHTQGGPSHHPPAAPEASHHPPEAPEASHHPPAAFHHPPAALQGPGQGTELASLTLRPSITLQILRL